MSNNLDCGLLTEEYILKRMVYVNSASHGYSEILLDHHLAMFGDNNAGKTASLAGTKLLLFPEVDFRNCGNKFRFEGKNGKYSMEESYDFYFPDHKSFIALEVENPEGMFCMVLYKMGNYRYGRFFVPLAYDEIRHVFWDEEESDFATELSIKSVQKFVKQSDGIQENSAKNIVYLMYDSIRGGLRDKRFCVLPLKDARPDSIEAFRNIYQLAFDTSDSETKSLPKAIATLLEMGRGRDEERLDANLSKLSEEHSQLVQKEGWLQSIANEYPTFQRITDNFGDVKSKVKLYSELYSSALRTVATAKQAYLIESEEHGKTAAPLKRKVQELQLTMNTLLGSVNKDSSQLEYREKQLKRDNTKLAKTKQKIGAYGSTNVEDITSNLADYLREIESKLEQYKAENGVRDHLQRLISEKNKLRIMLSRNLTFVKETEKSTLHQLLDDTSSSLLSSLNKGLSQVLAPVTEEQRIRILKFSELLGKTDSGKLTLLGEDIPDCKYTTYDLNDIVQTVKIQIEDGSAELNKLEKEISVCSQAMRSGDNEKLIAEAEKDRKMTAQDIEDISGMASLESSIRIESDAIQKAREKLQSDNISLEGLKNKHAEISSVLGVAEHQQQLLVDQQRIIKSVDESLKTALSLFKPVKDENLELQKIDLTEQLPIQLVNAATEVSKLKTSFSLLMHKLLTKVPLPNVEQHKDYLGFSELSEVVMAYEHQYATLDYDLNQHRNEIRSHNQLVSNQLNELKEAKRFLSDFISEINSELNEKHVSNLSEIKLNLSIDNRFKSLLATLEKHDIEDDTLLEADFYVSLAKFVESYFNKKTRRLKMHDIISSINYHYTLKETGETVTKSQSGGTTSTITAFVLSVLLRRLIPPYVTLKMPIIVDEISTLDFKNTDSTIKQISDHGFSIFCATPSFSGYISRKVGRWVMIDRKRVDKPIVSKCHMNILPHHIEGFGECEHET
ncbi:hypothetical protein [Shewanella sp. 4_MG-2023]|uniref:hypothetical protein n=1 Tax=Shewanella sp. 4_MG-2023 TaxID=3062652 RepID=UPI0026E200D4|nr:hypothetical protein [Shewanella sp. 4_MG-2023]MDO6677090.1 hypothetical protein [Shewanella sp. 4_MG-2023]